LIATLLLRKDIDKGSMHISNIVSVAIPDPSHAFNEPSLIFREQTETFCKRNLAHASSYG
jgi:hypothetical protein